MCIGDIIGKWLLIYVSQESEQGYRVESKDWKPCNVVREPRSKTLRQIVTYSMGSYA